MRNRALHAVATAAAVVFFLSPVLCAQKKPNGKRRLVPQKLAAPQANQIITIAGGEPQPSGAAREAELVGISGLAVSGGWIYFSDATRHIVARTSLDGSTVETLAGTQVGEFNGDGKAPLQTSFHVPSQLAVAGNGDVYVADTHNHRIRVIPKSGNVKTVAGVGIKNVEPARMPTAPPIGPGLSVAHFSGDGAAAADAELNLPTGVALDGDGVYIGDSGNNRVRVVNTGSTDLTFGGVRIAPGQIQTIAGTGAMGYSGDGGPALGATFAYPKTLTFDASGNLLVVDSYNKRLRRINRQSGVVDTIAIGGTPNDGALALFGVEGVARTAAGDVVYTDLNHHAVFQLAKADLDAGGMPPRQLIAGVGMAGVTKEVGPATGALIAAPGAVATGPSGQVYFVETGANQLRQIVDGQLSTLAARSKAKEGIPGSQATFSVLAPIATDPAGNIYLGDANLHSVRRIDGKTGAVTTFAGTGESGFSGDGGPATAAMFIEPAPRWAMGDNALIIVDPNGCRVRRVRFDAAGNTVVETIAGNGSFGYSGDGGQAAQASLSLPIGSVRNPRTGDIFITSLWMPTVRKVDRSGIISTYAGSGQEGYGGDGGPARSAQFHWPTAMAIDGRDNLYVVDFFNNRIRVVTPDGRIDTFAGNGQSGYGGDGGPARDASFDGPNDIVFGPDGAMYVTDTNNHVVRRIEMTSPNRITTVVGTGQRGYSGDNGPPSQARLSVPRGLAWGPDGTLYITDSLNRRVRAVRFAQ